MYYYFTNNQQLNLVKLTLTYGNHPRRSMILVLPAGVFQMVVILVSGQRLVDHHHILTTSMTVWMKA